jgi:hypothetical protein
MMGFATAQPILRAIAPVAGSRVTLFGLSCSWELIVSLDDRYNAHSEEEIRRRLEELGEWQVSLRFKKTISDCVRLWA